MNAPRTIKIDEVEYVRSDSLKNTTPYNFDGMVYAIIRSRDQGVVCGFVDLSLLNEGRKVEVRQARQIWRWDSDFVLQELAEKGPRKPEQMQMSCAMSNVLIMLEACSVLVCTTLAAKALQDIPAQVKK